MISRAYLTLLLFAFVYSSEEEAEKQLELTTVPPQEYEKKVLTEVGYLRYGNPFFIYPTPGDKTFDLLASKIPEEYNEVETTEEGKKQPLFFFTTNENPLKPSQQLPAKSGPYIEIRKKRDVEEEIPESSKVGKLRRKRTYCRKCGHGRYGGGGYYPVAAYAIYPVYTSYYPAYYGGGGGGNGCHTCGGGGGGGGGFGGSYSYSSSSAQSSSGSFGWGK